VIRMLMLEMVLAFGARFQHGAKYIRVRVICD
jgi:hypothetical protein